jgi:TolA-binding protein
VLTTLAACAAGAGVALGCGWTGFDNSIRFGYGATDLERMRLPPLPSDPRGAKKKVDDEEVVSSRQLADEADKVWDEADEAAKAGELPKAARLLRDYLARTDAFAQNSDWEEPINFRERRSSALDRLDALGALESGSTARAVGSYLAARRRFDNWLDATAVSPDVRQYATFTWLPDKKKEADEQIARKQSERQDGFREWEREIEENLASLARDANLADNADYLRAAGTYRAGFLDQAAERFEAVAAKYPRGEKREAALFTAGRALTRASRTHAGDGETATSKDPCREEGCRDEAWSRARKNFERLIEDYPRGRFAADARGWLAYLSLRVGDTGGALIEYYRMLADADRPAGQEAALRSLRLVRGRAGEADMDAVEARLEREPQAALAYAYHNLYNYSAGYYLGVPEVAEENPYAGSAKYYVERSDWQERKEQTLRDRAERRELRRVADFAARLMRTHPRADVGGAFAVRLAGAQSELGDVRAALQTARRALTSQLPPAERARALWIVGASEHRLKDNTSARRTLSRLVDEFPEGDLARGARAMLATAAEDEGDLSGALEQYLALGYEPDVAYFLDVLMTPDQLSSFVASHRDSPRSDELLYALGLRMMRAGRYGEARDAFTRVRTAADSDDYASTLYNYSYNPYGEDKPRHPKLNFRHTFWDEYGGGDGEYVARTEARAASAPRDTRVYADWLLRDLKTLDDLERLGREAERAEGDEAKAEALYQLASYFYEGNLLTYNPAAWRAMRAEMLDSLDETEYRAPAEAQTIWRHAQDHEAPARAVALYLEVVRLYPRARAAPDALYTAILCHQQLANFNGYWRGVYDRGLHAGSRLVTFADLRREYPKYRPPTEVGRWQPSTRTVSGGPAWPEPPKPRRLTGMERARLKLKRAELRVVQGWELFGEVAGGRARRWTLKGLRWLSVLLAGLFVLRVLRRTRRTRRFLYRRLVRRLKRGRETRAHEVYAPKSSYAAHLPHARGGTLWASVSDGAGALARLALHERGRAALAVNLFTHGLLTALVWACAWALKG